MAAIRARDLRALLDQVGEDAILIFEENPQTGKMDVGVVNPDELPSCSSCETCETPCSDKKAPGDQ